MSDLLRSVLEVAAALLERATLGSKTARGLGLLLLGHGLALSPATPFATFTTRGSLGISSRPASFGLATHFVHASRVVSDGLAMMLFVVVAVAAQRAHTTGALVVRQTLRTFVAAIRRCLRAVLSEVVVALAVATGDTRRPRRRTEGMDVVRRSPGIRPRFELQLNALRNLLPSLGCAGWLFLSI